MSPQELRNKLKIKPKEAGFFDAPLTQKASSTLKDFGGFVRDTVKSPSELRSAFKDSFDASKRGVSFVSNAYKDYTNRFQSEFREKNPRIRALAPFAQGVEMGLFLPREIGAGAIALTKEAFKGVPEDQGIRFRNAEEQKELEKKLFNREVPSISEAYVDPAVKFAGEAGSGTLEKFGVGALAFGLGFLAENPYTGKATPFKRLSESFLNKLAKEADEAKIAKTLEKELGKEVAKEVDRSALAKSLSVENTPDDVRNIIDNFRRIQEAKVAKEAPQVVVAKNPETGTDTVFRVRNADVETVRKAINASKAENKPSLVAKPVQDLLDRGFEDGGLIGRTQVEQLTKTVDDLTGTVDDLVKPTLKSPAQLRQAISSQPRTADGRFTFNPNKEAQSAKAGRAGAKEPDNLVEEISDLAENSIKNEPDGGVRANSLKALRENPEKIREKPVELREIEDGRIVIVDGRHRLQVARETGISPNFIDVTDRYPAISGKGTAQPSQRISELITPVRRVRTPRRRVATPTTAGFVDFSKMFGDTFRRKDLLDILKDNPEFQRVETEIFAEFDIAQAGRRIVTEDGVIASPSTFPKWIPEHLRSKKLMDKVLDHLDNGIEPKVNATRERELYDSVLNEMESRMGVHSDAYTPVPDSVLDEWNAETLKKTAGDVRKTVSGTDAEGMIEELKRFPIDEPIKDTPRKAMKASQGEMNFFEVPPETIMDKIRRTLHDKFRRLEVTQKAIGSDGKKLPEDMDAFLQQELYVGRTAERLDQSRNAIIRNDNGDGSGLLERMRKDDVTVEDLGRYMHAKHAVERNAKVRSVNENLPDGGSGLTDAQAKKILDEFKDNKQIVKYAKEFREKVINERIKILREEDLMTEEALEKITTAYENYVPLKVADKTTRIGASGKGFSAQGKDVKRVVGSTKERSNPVIQAIVDLEDTIIKAEKNKVGKAFLKLVRQNPNKDFWEVEPLKYAPRFNKEGEVIMLDPKYKFAENVMEVREAGKVRLITIHDKELARAMKNLGTEKAVSKVLMAFNSYLRGVITFYNPEFMLTNFQRDIQTALINVAGEKKASMAKDVAKDIPSAMRGIYRETRGKKPAIRKKGTDWQAVYREMKEEGGRVGWFDLNEVGERTKDTIKLIERYNSKGTVDTLRRGIDALGKSVSDMNETVEMAVRVSTYKQLVDNGMSKAKSARYAKNLTVNFNKKGNWGVMLNSLYLFANAGIQGTARIVTALKYPKVRAIVAGVAGSAYAINHLNATINPEGYERISDFEKDTNLILMLPPDYEPSDDEKKALGGNAKDGYYLKLRQPYGYNIFKVLGDSAYNMTSGKKTVAEEMKHLMLAMDTAFNPLSSGSLLQLASPTFSDPIVQQLENKNWFGSPIKPDQPAYAPPVRESSLYFKGASKQSRAVSEWLNRVTGGNEVEAGFIDISPELIDHYIDFIAGGVGDLFNATVDTAITIGQGEMPDIEEMPFIRKFVDKPFEQFEKFEVYDLLDRSATKKLDPVQRERFIDYVGTALETEQFDEDTGQKIIKEFIKNEDKMKAGEIFSLYKSGDIDKAIEEAGGISPTVDKELRKLLEAELEERLETANN